MMTPQELKEIHKQAALKRWVNRRKNGTATHQPGQTQKIKDKITGQKRSEETKARMSESAKEVWKKRKNV